MKFGEFVREHRKAIGMRMQEFANRLGVSISYLCSIEKSMLKPPSSDVCMRIATELNLNDDDVVDFFLMAMKERGDCLYNFVKFLLEKENAGKRALEFYYRNS